MFYILVSSPSPVEPFIAPEANAAKVAVEFKAAPEPILKEKPKTVREEVEAYFADIPILVSIASCESHFRQFEKDGTVKRGDINRYDLGVMQINELYHGEKAKEMGLDLHTLEGNLKFARYLYEKEGATPWSSSSKCWKEREIAQK